jgi:hypothetical protein
MSGIFLIGLVTALSTATASAETYHGVLCNASGNDVVEIGRNRIGAFNDSTTAVKRVHCGGASEGGIVAASANVYDRSVTDDVDCTFYITNASGSAIFTMNKKTTGFAAASMALNFGSVPGLAGAPVLQCLLPADNAQNGVSYVANYTFVDSP